MLRDVLLRGVQPVIDGDDYVFGKTRFPKSTPTAFKSSTPGLEMLLVVPMYFNVQELVHQLLLSLSAEVPDTIGGSYSIDTLPPINNDMYSDYADIGSTFRSDIHEIDLTDDLIAEKNTHASRLDNVLSAPSEGSYISSLEKKKEQSEKNIPKANMLSFDRMATPRIAYEIYDNTKLLKPDDWLRVAAVFVQGEAWQFKDWRWSNPVDLLSNVKGYYLKFDDSTVPDVVKSWDVKILQLSKSKRHLDHTAAVEFWNTFDEYVRTKKPYLNH
eukprot:gene16845-20029_t